MKRILLLAALFAAAAAGQEARAAGPGGGLRWLGIGHGQGYHASACCKYGGCWWSEPAEAVPAPPAARYQSPQESASSRAATRSRRVTVAEMGPQPQLAPPETLHRHKSVLVRTR